MALLAENGHIFCIKVFGCSFHLLEVQFHGDFHSSLVRSYNTFYNFQYFLTIIFFNGIPQFPLITDRSHTGIVTSCIREHIPFGIHHHNIFGIDTFHTIGHQRSDTLDLGRIDRPPCLEAQRHGCGTFLISLVDAVFRKVQVNTAILHTRELAYGLCQLTLQSPLFTDTFSFGSFGYVILVEEAPAFLLAVWFDSQLRHLQAQFCRIFNRYKNRSAVVFNFVGNTLAADLINDHRCLGGIHI